jgi:D-3-phosphoglycerate dehydrogenase
VTARDGAAPLALYADTDGLDVGIGAEMLERAGFRVEVAEVATEPELVALAGDLRPRALLATYAPIGAATFAAAPSIRIVSICAVGFDRMDVEAATAAGVWVANVPAAATEEVATHAFAMALALVRRLPFLDRSVRGGAWAHDAAGTPGRLSEMTLGVVGLGRIGRRLVELAGGTFGRVLGHDPFLPAGAAPAGVELSGLEHCLAESDVVSLHLPLSEATAGIIDAVALARMRKSAFLVNVSRGGLVDEAALLEALDGGRLAGAALDVASQEPPPPDSPLRTHPRLLLTPHSAFHSDGTTRAYLVAQAENVVAWARTGTPVSPVNRPRAAGSGPAGARD